MSRDSKNLNLTRNIGIMAHIDAGKTSVTERILYFSGETHKIGETHEGTAVMDYLEQERERGITIESAATTVYWDYSDRSHRVNIIDTPGHVDFTVEVERSLRVLDGAVAVFCAVGGVQPQSETVWLQADKYRVPRLAFVNKMDMVGADYWSVLEQIRDRLAAVPAPIQIPIGSEASFSGSVDLLRMRAVYWDRVSGEMREGEIPLELLPEAEKWREHLLETVSEHDDALLERFLEDSSTITAEDLIPVLRKATLSMSLVPVLCGTAKFNIGIQSLLDAVAAFLPSPVDIGGVDGIDVKTERALHRNPDVNEPFCGLAFKIATDGHVGRLVYIRVYSGVLKSGDQIFNPRTGRKERVSRLFEMHAKKREPMEECCAGDICVAVGLKDLKTSDTLCDPSAPLMLDGMQFPEPVISLAIEPKSQKDLNDLSVALSKELEADPSLRAKIDPETGQTVIYGMGELHFDIVLERLRSNYKLEVNKGEPRVSYREAVTQFVEQRTVFKKQTGGRGKFADIIFELGPADEDVQGLQFIDEVKGGNIPREFIPSVQAGFEKAMSNGVLAGYPVMSLKVRLIDGSYHPVDSDQLSFETAAVEGFKEACRKASPVLLEPIMRLEVVTYEEYMGAVVADLNRRRGEVNGMETRQTRRVITATVPLSELFGYVTALRSLCSGRVSSTTEFDHYKVVPDEIAKTVLDS